MGSQIKFTQLYGATYDSPLCSLLEINSFTFLLDCGWTEEFDVKLLDPLKQAIPRVDAVLLSHPDTAHLGALPYAIGRLGLKVPIYATQPTCRMGQMFMYDQYLSHHAASEFDLFDLDDVDTAFDYQTVHQLKFQQNLRLAGKGNGLIITPFAAGHMIGGSIWRITSAVGEDVVYAVDYNHRKELHLNSTALSNLFSRPALMIADADSGQPQFAQKTHGPKLLDAIMLALRNDGSILMPVDTAGRVLEVAKEFESSRDKDNPFSMRYVKLCHTREELGRLPQGPKLVLATLPSLQAGMARDLFLEWAADPKNLILFTQQAEAGSLGAKLQAHSLKGPSPLTLQLPISKRVPLEGAELVAYQEQKRKEEMGAVPGPARQSSDAKLVEPLPTRHSSGSIAKLTRRLTSMSEGHSMELDTANQLAAVPQSDALIDGFTVPEGAAAAMFPFEDENDDLQWDEYGAALRPDEFQLKATSRTGGQLADDEDEDMDDAPVQLEAPSKIVTTNTTVNVRARIACFDCQGRSDARSIREILVKVAPQQLILLHGLPQATAALQSYCQQELSSIHSKVQVAQPLEVVDMSLQTPTYQALLARELLSSVRLRAMGDYKLGWLKGVARPPSQQEALIEIVSAAAAEASGSSQGGVFIGDVRLSEVRKALSEAGITAEWYGGMLVCSGPVTIKVGTQDGQVQLEGALCDDYFRIRDVVYGQYHVC
ncbi:hypothetical protein WJX79_001220 [Trebouxia sp. C0005]